MKEKMVKVSIIFTVYNSAKFLDECLDSLQNQTYKDYEIITIDDCSTDETKDLLDKRKILYHKNEKNLGFAGNVNKGVSLSKGEYIMVVDHDMVYDKDYLKNMMSDPQDIMTGRCYYYPRPFNKGNIIRGYGITVNLLTGKTTVFGRDKSAGELDYPDSKIMVNAGGGGTLVFKREVFDKVQFDEEFYKYYVDLDFCYAARKLGYETFLSPAECWHKKEKNEEFEKEALKKYYQDKKRFLKKHSPYYPFCLIPSKLKQLIK